MNDNSYVTGYQLVKNIIFKRIHEKLTLIQFLIGPRQVGKTTLLLEIKTELKNQAYYVTGDSPEASLPHWRKSIWERTLELPQEGPRVLLIDEVQSIPQWSEWLKNLYDQIQRENLKIKIIVSGSSSLQIGAGSRESMAGRFERLTLRHWSPSDLIHHFQITSTEAVHAIIQKGGYPGAVKFWSEPDRLKDYLLHSMIEPAIGRDILLMESVRKPELLRQVFALATAFPAEIISIEKLAGSLMEKGSLETISHYLHLLKEAFLVAPLQKYSGSELRRRKSPPKLITLNNALLLGSQRQLAPDPLQDPSRWGRWVENACIAEAISKGLDVYYWREEPWEVDAIFIGDHQKWIIEVKTGSFTSQDLKGLSQASLKFPDFKALVLCDPGQELKAEAAGFSAMSWHDYLLGKLWKSNSFVA